MHAARCESLKRSMHGNEEWIPVVKKEEKEDLQVIKMVIKMALLDVSHT